MEGTFPQRLHRHRNHGFQNIQYATDATMKIGTIGQMGVDHLAQRLDSRAWAVSLAVNLENRIGGAKRR